MRLKLNKDNYIVGYGCFGNENYPEYEWTDNPEELVDELNQSLYYWNGKKPVYKPQAYTEEQTEQLRASWCKTEIEKLYPNDRQLKILTESMTEPTEAYIQMQLDRKKIIAESKLKDFQIEGDIKCK